MRRRNVFQCIAFAFLRGTPYVTKGADKKNKKGEKSNENQKVS
jgi:hypothetical protein